MPSTTVLYRLVAQDGASRTFGKVAGSAGGLEKRLGKLGRVAKVAGLALGAVGAGALKAADQAAEFQAAMIRISTQAGGTAKDVRTLSKQVLRLGTVTQQGPQALAESLYHLKSVGMDNVQAMRALKSASDLAAVGGADLEETTNALAGAWRTGIRGATSFRGAVSTVNAIIGAGNMSMEQFNAAIGTGILPSAKEFGLSLKQVGAAIALFTDEGIDSAAAATRLRMSFSLLGAPSAAAEKQLKKIGLTGLQLAEAMRSKGGLIAAVQLLKDHLEASGLSAAQQSQIMSRAFGGGRSSSAIIGMVNNLDVLKKKQDQVNRSTGRFAEAVKAQKKTAEAQWHLLMSNLQVASIRIGTKILPPLTSLVHYVTTTAAPAVIGFGKTLVDKFVPVSGIQKSFKAATSSISDFIAGVKGKDNTVRYKVGLGFETDQAPMSAAQKQGLKLRQALTGGLGGGSGSDGLGGTLGRVLGSAASWLTAHAADLSNKIASALGGIDWVEIGKNVGTQAIPFFVGFTDNFLNPLFSKKFWAKHWEDILVAFVSIVPMGKAGSAIGKIGERIPWGELFSGVGRVFEHIPLGKVADFAGVIGRWATNFGKGFVDVFSRQFPRLAAWFGRELSLIPTRLGVLGIELGRQLGKAGNFLASHVPGMGNKFIRAVAKFWGRFTFYQTGIRVAQGLLSGIANGLGNVGGWLKAHLVDPVVNWVKSLFGIHSPSRVFAAIGHQIPAGLRAGIAAGVKGISGWLKTHMVDPVRQAFSGAGGWLVSRGRAFVSGLKSGVIAGAKGITGWEKSHVINPALHAFAAAGSWLLGRGKSLVSGLKSGTIAGAKGITGWEKSHVINPALSAFSGAGSWLLSKGSALVSGLKSGIKSGVKGISGWLKTHMVDPIVSAVKHHFGIKSPSRVFAALGGHLVSGLVKGMATLDGLAIAKKVFGSLPNALGAIVGKGLISISGLPGKALKALGGLGGKFGKLLGGLFGGGGGKGGGASRWASTVSMALALLGAPQSALGAVLRRIQMESGGNPHAINLWDVNAKMGHPSQGLMQTIPGTFAAYAGPFRGRGITDPLANIYAGINYAMHRYGRNWISVMTRPGGYAKGGLAPIGQTAWVGERGAELMQVTARGTRIFNHRDSMAMASSMGVRLPGYASGTISNAQARVNAARAELEKAKERHLRVKAAEARLKAALIALANVKRTARASIANTLANSFLKTLATGTASRIATAIKSLNSKLLNAGYGRLLAGTNKAASKLEKLANQRAAVQSRIAKAQSFASDQSDKLGEYLAIGDSTASSVNVLAVQMQQRQDQARKFASTIASLAKRGLNRDLLAQVADQGPGGNLARMLATATPADIARLNALAKSQAKITSGFGRNMADAMYDSGKNAGKGFLTGLQSQEKALQKAIDKLAKSLVKGIKKALKIKSPSVVARDEVGKMFGAGVVAGMDAHGPHVAAAARRMAATAVGANWKGPHWYGHTRFEHPAHGHGETQTLRRLVRALEQGGTRGGDTHNTYNLHHRDMTVQELMTLQRVQETRQRVGRPR